MNPTPHLNQTAEGSFRIRGRSEQQNAVAHIGNCVDTLADRTGGVAHSCETAVTIKCDNECIRMYGKRDNLVFAELDELNKRPDAMCLFPSPYNSP